MRTRGRLLILVLVVSLLLGLPAAYADEPDGEGDHPWNNHSAPFDFLFGNMIDTHQQSKLNSQEHLNGFIYIHYTGEVTPDGYPVARKANCLIEPCTVGWVVKGKPITATLLQTQPRVWLVDPADLPDQAGYSHFQWVGSPTRPSGLVVGQEYSGILLRRVAPMPFFWLGGSGGGGGSGGCGGCGGHEGDDGHDGGDGHDGQGGNGSSGHGGRLVLVGIDHHSNIVTDPADIGHGGGGGGCGDGCSGH